MQSSRRKERVARRYPEPRSMKIILNCCKFNSLCAFLLSLLHRDSVDPFVRLQLMWKSFGVKKPSSLSGTTLFMIPSDHIQISPTLAASCKSFFLLLINHPLNWEKIDLFEKWNFSFGNRHRFSCGNRSNLSKLLIYVIFKTNKHLGSYLSKKLLSASTSTCVPCKIFCKIFRLVSSSNFTPM